MTIAEPQWWVGVLTRADGSTLAVYVPHWPSMPGLSSDEIYTLDWRRVWMDDGDRVEVRCSND